MRKLLSPAPLIRWARKRFKEQYMVLMLAVVVGIASGLVAVVLKNAVHFIQWVLTLSFTDDYLNWLYLIYPLAGIMLTVFVVKRWLLNQPVGNGIPNVLYSISKRNSIMKRLQMINALITSAITVGFGGSVGLEGPTVGTTGAIGSNIGRAFNLSYKNKTMLIGCAAAGSLASMFNAPIAAIVFVIEVLLLDLTMSMLIPLLLASVVANLTSKLFLEDIVLIHFDLTESFVLLDVPFFILLGIVCGWFSVYCNRSYFGISKIFERIKPVYGKALIGGTTLGLLIFFLPPLYGEGYKTINALINGKEMGVLANSMFYSMRDNVWVLVGFLVATGLLKMVAATVTMKAGGVGGTFAPTLFMGSICGFVFAKVADYLGIAQLSTSNYTLVGMAGMVAGILHAPLTAIFLIAEITGGYELFIPLMITTSISYITVRKFTKHSIYHSQLAKRGELITHHKDQAVLTLMKLGSEIERDFQGIRPDETLGDLVKVVATSNRNIFPVVDARNRFLGMVNLDDIREVMFNRGMYDDTLVSDLMTVPSVAVSSTDSMDEVMRKFEETEAWNLPVVDDGKYVGFVSKSKLFSAYRNLLRELYGED